MPLQLSLSNRTQEVVYDYNRTASFCAAGGSMPAAVPRDYPSSAKPPSGKVVVRCTAAQPAIKRMIAFLLQGIGLGFTAGVQPGPFQAFVIQTALSRGWWRGLPVIFAPLIMDTPLIVLTLLALETLRTVLPALQNLLYVAGGLLLLWIAWGAWKQLRAGLGAGLRVGLDIRQPAGVQRAVNDTAPVQAQGTRALVFKAVSMNLVSYGPYLFWLNVNGPLLRDALSISVFHGIAFLVGFYGTFLLILLLTLVVFDRVGRLNPRVMQGAMLLTILILLVLGAWLLLQGVTGVLQL